ncbi:lysozyme [Phenylobacterium sp.]|uniref:lysozyme n=1 Tax=Phenylobacterium sp. TaxID=1871053 RepID=UPI0027335CF7|nr:glycoside hydrolase family protein [Phenylobacterium sp.]MDP3855401.1 glycoside hydrolase family protein [Phenylobacterium sp.]
MKPRFRITREAIEHIKRFEGYRRRSAQLPAGGWTIGYGHTLTAREGAEVSESDAEALLLYDLIAVAHAVNEHVFAPLTQNQFDALCAFAFNIGVENFQRSSVLRRLNEGQLLQAASAMELWRKAEFEGERIVVDALVRRRSVEKTLFLTPPGGFVPAPTPILRPKVDMDATGIVPRQVPTALAVALDGDHAVARRDETLAPQPVAPEEEAASPTQGAAEAVTSRLSTIFAEPEPPAAAEFALTPPEEDFRPEALDRVPRPPEPANESGPSLFDPPLLVANDHAAPEVEAASEPEPAEAFPETTSGPVADEPVAKNDVIENDAIVLPIAPGHAPTVSAVSALLPPAVLAVVGVGIFSGGVLGGVNNLPTLAWIASVVGIGLFAVAVYLLLDRLGQVEDEDDFESDEDDETRDE